MHLKLQLQSNLEHCLSLCVCVGNCLAGQRAEWERICKFFLIVDWKTLPFFTDFVFGPLQDTGLTPAKMCSSCTLCQVFLISSTVKFVFWGGGNFLLILQQTTCSCWDGPADPFPEDRRVVPSSACTVLDFCFPLAEDLASASWPLFVVCLHWVGVFWFFFFLATLLQYFPCLVES